MESRPAAGLYFKREWCAVVDAVPADPDVVRYWDLAATEKREFNDPDRTVGIELGRDKDGGYSLLDMAPGRANPDDAERLRSILPRRTARAFASASARIQGRPAKPRRHISCARSVASPQRRLRRAGDKLTRFGPFSSQRRTGNVNILRRPWNEELFRTLEGFPDLFP